jgi:NAD(P)-dependent dehydrogenase (short-subunit alcohol dehydrogenase family)
MQSPNPKETIMSNIVKTWFITGAASGFGRAFAAHALARGYNVVATARNLSKLQDLVAQAPARVALKPDVERAQDAKAAIEAPSRGSGASTSSSTMPAMALSAPLRRRPRPNCARSWRPISSAPWR